MSNPNKKAIKLATKSEKANYFMPMLESMNNKDELNEVVKNCIVKSCDLLDDGVELYPNNFFKEYDIAEIRAEYEAYQEEELQEVEASFALAGRVLSLRSFGKVIFFHIMDRSGRMQCYADKAYIPEEEFNHFKKYDIGDIVGVHGSLFRTKTGELTLRCTKIQLLSKSFRTLPEKHKGMTNVELRYRQRYVDLIVTPKVRDIFKKRSKIVKEFRRFMEMHSFMEVETPMLQPIAGGATARPFLTHHNALEIPLYMRIAPELYLKRLLVGGFEKVYELNRCFRNEGTSTRHNPEFTMAEFYWAYADFYMLMDFTEQLFAHIALEVCGTTTINYQGTEIDLTPGHWNRISFHDSLREIGGHAQTLFENMDSLKEHLVKRGEKDLNKDSLGQLQARLFDLDVEPKLIQPSFIYHYPTDISPLSRRNDNNPDITDRFELFIYGREMSNAFSELNDPVDQRLRFEDQVRKKHAGDDEAHAMDEDYLRALEFAMPPAAGQGIGIDRLVMLLTDSASIREVILFPLLKPEEF